MFTKFNEWMSFRQSVELPEGDYQFIGTYNNDQFPNLKEDSNRIDFESALSLLPQAYQSQFSNVDTISAGKIRNENKKEILWISSEQQNITYLFEKK